MTTLAPGERIDVTIERLEPYGAWVSAEGERGLIRIPEIGWSRISHPADVLAVGQVVRVVVLALGRDEFSASLRAMHPEQDPWRDPSAFAVGTTFAGRVVRVVDWGAWVEVRPDVWGLLRRERWLRKLAVGDLLSVTVVVVDVVSRKIEIAMELPGKASETP